MSIQKINNTLLANSSNGSFSSDSIPSSWGGGYKGIQVGTSAIMASPSDANMRLLGNAYYDGTNYKYILTNGGSAMQLFGHNGYGLYYAQQGTAGANISYATGITMDNKGNVAIGADSTTNRLEVRDTGNTQVQITKTGANSLRLLSHSTGSIINQVDNYPLAFHTNNTEKMRLHTSGNLQFTAGGVPLTSAGDYMSMTSHYGAGNAQWHANGFRIANHSIGNTGDPSYGYVLLCEAWTGSGTQLKQGFFGQIWWHRGGPSAGNFSYSAIVSVASGYSSNHVGGKAINGSFDIVQLTWNSTKYIAIRPPYTSSSDVLASAVYCSGTTPQVVSDGSVSSVSVIASF